MTSASASSSSASASAGLFDLQAQKYAELRAQEKEKEKAEKETALKSAEESELAKVKELQEMTERMYQVDDETFLALAATNPALPETLLKTSKGVNHFLQRFHLQTVMVSPVDDLRLLSETYQWKDALEARGKAKEPIDLKLSNVWLSKDRLEKILTLFPNVRSIEIKGYVYQGKEHALNIRELINARLPAVTTIEMSDGHGFEVQNLMHALNPKSLISAVKKLVDAKQENPRRLFCRAFPMNVALNTMLDQKRMTRIDPIILQPKEAPKEPSKEALKEEAPDDVGEWEAPALDEWEPTAASNEVDDWGGRDTGASSSSSAAGTTDVSAKASEEAEEEKPAVDGQA